MIAALRYAQHLNDFGLDAYPVITTTHNDGPEFDVARNLNVDAVIEDFIDPEGKPQVLVVVDRLITGFDAPVEQVLYLDRSIREHTLLQAIARVNRRFSHTKNGAPTEKQYGLVVDYHGVSRELESALAIFDSGDLEQALTELPEDPGPVIQAAADKDRSALPWARPRRPVGVRPLLRCRPHDRGRLQGRRLRAVRPAITATSRRYMDRYLPDPAALAYIDRLRRLTVIRSYCRAPSSCGNAPTSIGRPSGRRSRTCSTRASAPSVRELMAPVSILDQDFEQKIERLPHDEARASLMEHALRAQIKERVEENPVFYERLSEALERIIRELRDKLIDAAEGCKRLAALRDQITQEEAIATEHGLTPVSFAVYGLLAGKGAGASSLPDGYREVAEDVVNYDAEFDGPLTDVARDIEDVIQEHRSIIDWHENLDVQREMRRDIKRLLRDAGRYGENELDELVRQVVEVARSRLA